MTIAISKRGRSKLDIIGYIFLKTTVMIYQIICANYDFSFFFEREEEDDHDDPDDPGGFDDPDDPDGFDDFDEEDEDDEEEGEDREDRDLEPPICS